MCVPALPLLILLGVGLGQTVYAAIAAGAAYSVGFGAARELRGRRWGAMVGATAGMALAALIGSLTGSWLPLYVPIVALAAAGCAGLALYDENLWWVMLQLVIALLVAGYYPGDLAASAGRAVAVFLGGAAQILIVVALAAIFPVAAGPLPAGPVPEPPGRRLFWSHVLRAAVCVALSLGIALWLGLANSYWAPMTAMIVLKPGLRETSVRGLARVGGTLAGCAAATLFAIAVDEWAPLVLAGMAVMAGASYALQKAHYALLTAAITATVVLLLSLARGGVIANAEHRIVATLIGGLVALAIARIAPHRPPRHDGGVDRVGTETP